MKKIIFVSLIVIVFLGCNKSVRPLYRIQQNGIYGFIDSVGNEVIHPQYQYASDFTDNISCVITNLKLTKDSMLYVKYGYIDSNNKLIIDTTLEIRLKLGNNLTGSYYNENLKEIVDNFNNKKLRFRSRILDMLEPRNGRIVYQDKKSLKFGYINYKGEIAIEPKFILAERFSDSVAVVKINNESILNLNEGKMCLNYLGVVDISGKVIVPPIYFKIENFTNHKTWALTVDIDKKDLQTNWFLLNNKGKIILGPISGIGLTRRFSNFSKDDVCIQYFKLLNVTRYSFMNLDGANIPNFDNDEKNIDLLKEAFSNVTNFDNGYAGIQLLNNENQFQWVLIDKNFNIKSEDYDSVGTFREGLINVKESVRYHSGKWGFLDNNLNIVIPFNFDECGQFVNGLAYFSKKGDGVMVEGYINKRGKIIWQTINNDVY